MKQGIEEDERIVYQYRLVEVWEARRLVDADGWGPVPLVETVQKQATGYVGATTYVWLRKEVEV